MTRLIDDWTKDISINIKKHEVDLIVKTGLDYVTLASLASGVTEEKIKLASKSIKIGVVPITTGIGIINKFSEAVAAVLKQMNFETIIPNNTDVTGIYEAHQKGAKIIFTADDNSFLAINLQKDIIVDNNIATAKGFIAALEGAKGSLKGKTVLVIGCGIVGKQMLKHLKQKQANPIAYDINGSILRNLTEEGYKVIYSSREIINYDLILDATNNEGWLNKDMIKSDAWIASPGVPISLDDEAYDVFKARFIHDYLQIGVATMLAMTCS